MISVALTLLLFEIAWGLSDGRLMVSIYPVGKSISCKENEDLNLTCRISGHELIGNSYELSWSLPIKSSSNNRVSVHKTSNELTVTIHSLQEGDTGQYVCEVRDGEILRRRKVSVLVKSGKDKCMKQFFSCGDGLCIPQHYICDGRIDCPDGNDEMPKYCGQNPCLGKFLCDGRCISQKLCCDPVVDANCSVNYIMPCCQRLLHHIADVESSSLSALEQQYSDASDIYFLQCTIYTIITFAVVFIIITVILSIIICRTLSRRSVVPFRTSHLQNPRHRLRLWPWHPSRVDRRTLPASARIASWNMDEHMSSCHRENASEASIVPYSPQSCQDPSENFVLLTYGSQGFEIADCVPKPPPYTEAVQCIEQPPPYASCKNLAEDEMESEQRLMNDEHMSSAIAQGEGH